MTPPKFRDGTWVEFLLSHIHREPGAIDGDDSLAPFSVTAYHSHGTSLPCMVLGVEVRIVVPDIRITYTQQGGTARNRLRARGIAEFIG